MQYSIPRRIWRIIYPVLIFVSISFAAVLLIGFVIGIYLSFREAFRGNGAISRAVLTNELSQIVRDNAQWLNMIAYLSRLAVFLPLWLVTRKHITRYKNDSSSVTALLIVGAFAGLNLLLLCAMSLTDILRFFPSYENVSINLSSGTLLAQILALGIAAPVAEEMCFRGVLLERMRWMPAWLAVLVQGALFALAHMNLFQGLYTFIAGILLALVYLRFRSITLAIIGHMSFNLASILINAFGGRTPVMAVFFPAFAAASVCAFLLCVRPGAKPLEESAIIS